MSSTLITHGARTVTREVLDKVEPPSATETWKPIKHAVVLDTVGQTMHRAGFHIRDVKICLARGNHRLFATIDTATNLNSGSVTLAIGVVNSTDRSLPMKFIAGTRVLVCSNLALRSDLMAPVRRKHSKHGLERFTEALSRAVASLDHFKTVEAARIKRFHEADITDVEAESVLLRCFDQGILSPRLLPHAIKEWREPTFEEFQPRTLWSLENALTTTLAPVQRSNPQRFCALSLSLQGLLSQVAGLDQPPEDAPDSP